MERLSHVNQAEVVNLKIVKSAELANGSPICKITFPFDLETLNNVRTLKDRKYHEEQNCWSCPMTVYNLSLLEKWGFRLEDSLQEFLEQARFDASVLKEIEVRGLKGELRPYQKVGVSFLEARNGRALIADGMGLGKTIQVIAYLQLHREIRPAIVIVPSSLKLNWYKELLAWMPIPHAEILSGRTPYKTTGHILILNYDIVDAWIDYLIKLKPEISIIDEAHNIKNNKAKRTKAVKKLTKITKKVVGLSGTPILNRPIEIFNIVNIINPTLFGSYWQFTKRYCGVKTGFGGHRNVNGASNTHELHRILVDSVMIRRLKKDVAKDLPDKKTSIVPISLTNADEYFAAERDFVGYLLSIGDVDKARKAIMTETLMKLNALRQLAIKGKMSGVLDWIEEFLESDEKLVVFATHTNTIDMIMERFPKISVRFDGTVNQKQRDKNVEAFQKDPNIKLFVGMLDSSGNPAGVGITLTAASNTATVEFQWSPGVHDQADDRVHRIGQKNAVINYKLVAADSIDMRMASLIDRKREIIDSVMDGKALSEESLVKEIIRQYQQMKSIKEVGRELITELENNPKVTIHNKIKVKFFKRWLR